MPIILPPVITGRTLYDMVRTVSFNLGDLFEGTLTGADSPSVLYDTNRGEPDGEWTGQSLAIVGTPTSSANAGVERSINVWTQAGSRFNTNAFPIKPSFGDPYELRRIKFHQRSAIIEFINQGIREVRRQSWINVDSRVDLLDTTTYSVDRIEYPVPGGMEFVNAVLYLDIDNQPVTTTAALPLSAALHDYWYLSDTQTVVEWSGVAWVPSTRIPWVELRYDWWTTNMIGSVLIQEVRDYSWSEEGNTPPIPTDAPIRFRGVKRPSELHNETDVTQIEGNYIEVFATARMALRLAKAGQDQQDFNMKFQTFYKLEADAFRGTRRGLPSGARKVI